jgi:hypothetical protein
MDADKLDDIADSVSDLQSSVNEIKGKFEDFCMVNDFNRNLSDLDGRLSEIVCELQKINKKNEFKLENFLSMVALALMIGFSVAFFLHK